MRVFRHAVVAMSAVMATTSLAGATLAAAAPAHYRFVNSSTQKCLDVFDESRADGAVVQQYECKSGKHQVFGRTDSSSGMSFFSANAPDKCLDLKDGALYNGGAVQIWSCTGAPNQTWFFNSVADGKVQIQNAHSGKCLTDAGIPDGKRRTVLQDTCKNQSSQFWQVKAA
ncbi:RICIN domain-containing protein [Streptomyces paludis]|nr:RICIN domain-containing protein [Streptomyces paludis]